MFNRLIKYKEICKGQVEIGELDRGFKLAPVYVETNSEKAGTTSHTGFSFE